MSTASANRPESETGAEIASLGASIRTGRRDAGLKLREVAAATGLSISYLSQIERDLLTPSVDALRRIANAVDISAGALAFAAGSRRGKASVSIVRREARKRVAFADANIAYELLTPDVQGRVSVLALSVPPGAESGAAFTHPGEDIVIVQHGALMVEVGGLWHEILAGDSIRFSSEIPHRWRNGANAPAQALWISSPPWL
ncbi:MAG: XRE family transcriptional regulator [Alphaproteobacteria bacterium]|nr:XRE family transcriptional regulator [Alphaproteobacteria bacterium]